MPEYKAPGVYTENTDPNQHPISGVSTTVTAFVGFTQSGPDAPTLLNSFADYTSMFGSSATPGGYMTQAVQGFFDNGGTQLYVSRINGNPSSPGSVLEPLEALDEISIVCCPDEHSIAGMPASLVAHCERMRYRIAVLAAPPGSDLENVPPADVRSALAAYYAPWVLVPDPCRGADLTVYPGGHIAGAIVRNDLERGVWKAPANLALLGITGLERQITDVQQATLSQRGVNVLRSFPAQGVLIWGARTTSQDPQWKYVNIRRYLNYLEQSIDQGLQWVVFEANGESLWSQVRQSIDSFLLNQFKAGALKGSSPAEAYFVRCDATTMTQDDIDKGRLVVLVGVAPLYPAEFIVFQIGEWTADATC
ncbi:MAG: phage tail sheath subtilisin-like domain-containing protein [Candidatus Korobacteraceae bacterium]